MVTAVYNRDRRDQTLAPMTATPPRDSTADPAQRLLLVTGLVGVDEAVAELTKEVEELPRLCSVSM